MVRERGRFWRRLSVRLVVSHLLVGFLIAVVALGITSWSVRRYLVDSQVHVWTVRAREIAPVALGYLEGLIYSQDASYVMRVAASTLSARIYVLDTLGQPTPVSSPYPPHYSQADLKRMFYRKQTFRGVIEADGTHWVAAGVPVVSHGQVVGAVWIESPLAGLHHRARSLTTLIFWAELVAMVVAGLVAYSLARRLSFPLESLRWRVERMGPDWEQDPPEPVPPGSPREVEELSEAFDGMRARIRDQVRGLEQEKAKRDALLGHVTHDLRTPLTSIRGFLEALRDRVVQGAEADRAVEIALEETLRLQRLVNRLLEATRIQSRTQVLHALPVGKWVEDTLERIGPVADQKGVRISWQAPPIGVEVFGVHDHLVEALLNVLDNAIKWTPAGSGVFVEGKLRDRDREVEVRVCDQGPGIDPDILPRVLDPFVTGDPSRSDSNGLGLAIVADVMEEHGGRVEVKNRAEGGAEVSLILPRHLAQPDTLPAP